MVPLPRSRPGYAVPDNSYAARAEALFSENRNMLSRDEQNDLLNPFSSAIPGRNKPMEYKNLT